ncbi:(2Fe-2S)-binding protein [bacterium]|nr:(2Fe-2S)-binding protein [bacterium]
MARKPIEYVEIEIDGQAVKVPANQVVLWSARELGYDIPHFCAHRWLVPYGACRMCLVKVEAGGRMMPKLQTSCSLMPAEGMKIWTKDPEVIQARREQLEFHLLNHPLECPVCDKGGECMLQDQTRDHGMGEGRFREQKRIRPDASMNPYIRLNYKRCIHCKRCVNYASDIDGSYFLQFVDRGAETYIESFDDPAAAPRFSGNVIDMCPVGALTAKSYRFTMGRPWEQELKPSIGALDSVGANIWLNARLGDVARIVPRDNPTVENGMLDDATRFGWEFIEDPRRLTRALVRGEEETRVSRLAGETEAGRILGRIVNEHGPGSVGLLAGAGLNTEEYLALKLFAGRVLNTSYYNLGDCMSSIEVPDDATLATVGSGFTTIEGILNAATVLTLGCDLFEEAPSLGLRLDIAARRGLLRLLNARSQQSGIDRFAELSLDYPFGGLLRFVRGLTNALTGQGEVPPEVTPLAERLRQAGEDCAIVCGDEVWLSEDPPTVLKALAALREAIAQASPDTKAVYLNPVYKSVNSAGALLVNCFERLTDGRLEGVTAPVGCLGKVLEAAAAGKLKALVIFDKDVLVRYQHRDVVEKALKNVEAVIYCGAFPNATSERAHVHLPLGTWAHREGFVINLEWRVQKRLVASIDSVAPSVLDVVNGIAAAMGQSPVAADLPALRAQLARVIPGLPTNTLDDLPDQGLPFSPKPPALDRLKASTDLPAEVAAPDGQLLLTPKRFLYNDREEIRFSRVFDKIPKPFYAFLNPADAAKLGVSDGEWIGLGGGHELELPVQLAAWVRPGSVVVNDYYLAQPANRLAGAAPAAVAVKKLAGVGKD